MNDQSKKYLETFIDKCMPRLAMGEIKVYLILLQNADDSMYVGIRYHDLAKLTGLTSNGVRYAMHVLRSLKLVKRDKYKPGIDRQSRYRVLKPKAISEDIDMKALRRQTRYHGVDL